MPDGYVTGSRGCRIVTRPLSVRGGVWARDYFSLFCTASDGKLGGAWELFTKTQSQLIPIMINSYYRFVPGKCRWGLPAQAPKIQGGRLHVSAQGSRFIGAPPTQGIQHTAVNTQYNA